MDCDVVGLDEVMELTVAVSVATEEDTEVSTAVAVEVTGEVAWLVVNEEIVADDVAVTTPLGALAELRSPHPAMAVVVSAIASNEEKTTFDLSMTKAKCQKLRFHDL